MASSNFSIKLFVFTILTSVLVLRKARAESMCEKFNLGGPCDMIEATTPPPTTTPAPDTEHDPFCQIACVNDRDNYNDVCHCYDPVTCYYGTQRAARLSTVVKRVWSGTPSTPECDYPGVVGVMRNINKVLTQVCMGVVLEEDKILITSACLTLLNSYNLFAMVDTWFTSGANKNYKLLRGSEQNVDPANDAMVVVSLMTPLTLNSTECVQPVCVPNVNIPVSDIDLNDCRLVGYGVQNDAGTSIPNKLKEVLVTVDPTSVTKKNLAITRVDSEINAACFSDDGAPLICSHVSTGEWITIGITTQVGLSCSAAEFSKTVVANLLAESSFADVYYSNLQPYKYADPTVFAA